MGMAVLGELGRLASPWVLISASVESGQGAMGKEGKLAMRAPPCTHQTLHPSLRSVVHSLPNLEVQEARDKYVSRTLVLKQPTQN